MSVLRSLFKTPENPGSAHKESLGPLVQFLHILKTDFGQESSCLEQAGWLGGTSVKSVCNDTLIC